ncbi:MAG: carboxypeptidase regulatory-like domain-containing protein, partial [Deltaproteobacteria bacterium]|nr:carboxypeptidase regulatory-like domain-containing protein [Deltaproteobacteria bacterium]
MQTHNGGLSVAGRDWCYWYRYQYYLAILILFIIFPTGADAYSVTLSTTTIQRGGIVRVSWSGFSGNVNVRVYKSSTFWVDANTQAPSSGYQDLNTTGWEIRSDYRIKIEQKSNTSIYLFSDYFSVYLLTSPTNVLATYQSASNWNYITWSSVSGATSYNVYWGTSPGVTTSSQKLTTTSINYAHSGVQAGFCYYYRVSAVNTEEESALSTEAYACVPAKSVVTGGVRDLVTSTPLSGATVRLEQSGNIMYTTTSNSTGNYSFSNVTPGSYNLVALATGYQNFSMAINAVSGQTLSQNIAMTANSGVTGGVRDLVTSTPLSGATVRLEQSGSIIYTTTSNSTGNYSFSNVTPGSYNLVALATGYQNFSMAVTVPTGQNLSQNITMTAIPKSVVTGGVRDLMTSAPLSGATVRLEQNGSIIYTTTSNSTGNYSFS